MNDTIKTIENEYRASIKEKGSEFIAYAFPVCDEESFKARIFEIKKEHFNARHHCFAYRIDEKNFKYSDDGEPNGTAGIRILNAIDHFELVYVGVVVVRYFGGIKLGVGPLGRVYYSSGNEVLSVSEIKNKEMYRTGKVEFDFNSQSQIYNLLNNYDVKIDDTYYSENVAITFRVKNKVANKLLDSIKENLYNSVVKIDFEKEYYI